MVNGLSLFFGGLIVIVAALGAIDASRDEREPWRELLAFLGLLVAASTRNLLWIYVGFEVFWLVSRASSPLRMRSLVSSGVSLVGVLVVAIATRTSDLSILEPTASVRVGVLLVLAGLVMKWLQSRATPFLFLGASLALLGVLVRVSGWAPATADALGSVAWAVATVAVVIGGVGSALSSSRRTLVFWLTVLTVGLAVFGLAGGPPALAHVLTHVAASVIMLALVSSGASPVGTWLAMLSLASFPPLPGFVTKLDLFAGLPPRAMTIALFGVLFAALGCVRELNRAEERERAWVTIAAVVATIVLGLFPDAMVRAAMRAAAGLF